MAFNVVRFELDITGNNPSNRVIDEPCTAIGGPETRAFTVKYGPFFAQSLIIKDGVRFLNRGSDYQVLELHQEATALYGKEISSVILIINQNVSSNLLVTYQALGGHYTYDDSAIINLYNSVINDNRPVDWSNVVNKPTEYPPKLHRHLLDDVYGFEAVVDYLERIKRVLSLNQYEMLFQVIEKLYTKFKCKEIPAIIPSRKIVTYDAMLHFVTYKKLINQVNISFKDCTQYIGDSFIVNIDSSGYPLGSTLYWEFYIPSRDYFNYATLPKGYFNTTDGLQTLQFYIPSLEGRSDDPLYVGLKLSPDDTEFYSVSYLANIQNTINKTNTKAGIYAFLDSGTLDTSEQIAWIEDDTDDERYIWTLSRQRTRINFRYQQETLNENYLNYY